MDHLSAAKEIVRQLVDRGHTAYFAGGWVRDLLLNHPSDDIDIATSASVAEIQSVFSRTVPVGIAFGIVIVVHKGHSFEVATFRQDSGYLDGRRPTEVIPSSPQEDAKRRDFTINGMFFDPLRDELHDFVGGKKDLEQGIIRAIGNPAARFLEDRLRMMRAIRYATRFGFKIEEKTKEALIAYATTLLPSVAIERIWQEFKKMSQFDHFDKGLAALYDVGLLQVIFPSLKECRIEPISRMPNGTPTIAEVLFLFPQIDQPSLIELCEYLKISSEEKEIALFLHKSRHLFSLPLTDAEWVLWYASPHAPLALQCKAALLEQEAAGAFLIYHAKRQEELDFWIRAVKEPVVRSSHLFKEGIGPGKKMGQLLKEAEKISIEHRLKDPDSVIAILKKAALWNT
ncbi:MAG: cCA-adding enzyme [Chlamydiota bacterium]|jgi:poly(A) polymerase